MPPPMHIEIDPDLVELGEPDPKSGLSQVYYAGMPVPQLFRFLPPVTGVSTVRYYVAKVVEERLAAMSAHERLPFAAAARTSRHQKSTRHLDAPDTEPGTD